jgi:hypothetical protein
VVERKPKHAGHEQGTDAQRTLVALLELSLGNPTVAHAAIAHALAQAGRDALPPTGPEVVAFARAYLMSILTGELGPRLTLALLDDLIEHLDPPPAEPGSGVSPRSTAPPGSVPRRIARIDFRPTLTPAEVAALSVLIVDPDKIRRPALARALLRAKWSVRVIDSPSEVALADDEGERFAAAMVDLSHPASQGILDELVARFPSVIVVARCADPMRAHVLLGDMGVASFDVRSDDAPPEELIDAARKLLAI